jgi:drug/metabolite transporter (DMT)-like permease
MLPILFGLSSALLWGAADFCGGLASRKGKAYQAVMFGEAVGLVALLVAALISGEPQAPWQSWLMCTIAGSMGVLGLLLFFHSMTKGQMSVAAPVSALTAAVLPVLVGSFLEGFPGWLTFVGFGLALASIWLISSSDGSSRSLRLRLADLSLPLIAGLSFGVYLILVEQGSQHNVFWPMVASRTAGTVTMVIYTLVTRQTFLPSKSAWPLIIANGILDISGNGMYVLAGQAGRMDVAAVLASLYPGSTVVLAGLILHERLNRLQWTGIVTALVAIVLMTV